MVVNISSIAMYKLCFDLNRDYFANNLCVNKDKPKLKCAGKCHLNKVIKAISKNQTDKEVIQQIGIEYVGEQHDLLVSKDLLVLFEIEHLTQYQFSFIHSQKIEVFRPPLAA